MILILFIFVSLSSPSFGFLSRQKQKSEELLSSSRILLFYGTTFNDRKAFALSSAVDILKHPKFDDQKKTVFYIHGYRETIDDENIQTNVAAYQKRNDHNILILDWVTIANGNYLINALPNTIAFSQILSDVFLKLFALDLNIQKFHVVTHSLGSQLGGLVGRAIQRKSNGRLKLKRITCLDPAFPGFYPPFSIIQSVNEKDAEFVDVIHTDSGIYGTPFSTGTVDFWPNGATLFQPGCPMRNFKILDPQDLCSHWLSWRFWAESVQSNSSLFLSHKCDSIWKYDKRTCDSNHVVSMGIDCQLNITGDYFLRTRAESPYSY